MSDQDEKFTIEFELCGIGCETNILRTKQDAKETKEHLESDHDIKNAEIVNFINKISNYENER